MKTAFYWPAFLGPMGKQADFWAVVHLLQETLTASDLELFLDTDPTRPALARLFAEIRKGRVNRVVVRSLSDLCLTSGELMQFAVEVTTTGVKFEQIFHLLPSVLVWKHPELVGRYRHRQLMAKVLRMRATPQQVYRILSRPR